MTWKALPVIGHTPIRKAPEEWICKCGLSLGRSRAAARDVMRFHRMDLWGPHWRTARGQRGACGEWRMTANSYSVKLDRGSE